MDVRTTSLAATLVHDRAFVRRCRRHATTVGEIVGLWAKQGSNCAVCRRPEQDLRSLVIDHNHDTGRIRGLLCGPCNTGLGLLGDNPRTLNRAADYLADSGFYGTSPGAAQSDLTPVEQDAWAGTLRQRYAMRRHVLNDTVTASEHRKYHAWRARRGIHAACPLCDPTLPCEVDCYGCLLDRTEDWSTLRLSPDG